MKVIFIQGPPGSGKDTLAASLDWQLSTGHTLACQYKFAQPIRDFLLSIFGDEFDIEDEKESAIETVFPATAPITVRQLMIDFSEDFLKPRFTKEIFGEILRKKLADEWGVVDFAIISDCGFVEEALPILEFARCHHCTVIQISRDGHSFDGDSRNYWDAIDLDQAGAPSAGRVRFVPFNNSGDMTALHSFAETMAEALRTSP